MRKFVALLVVSACICLALRAMAQSNADADLAKLRRECALIESGLSGSGERLLALGRRLDELRRELAEPGHPDVERRVLQEQLEQLRNEQGQLARAIIESQESLGECRAKLDAAEAKNAKPVPPPVRTARKAPPPRRAAPPVSVAPSPNAPVTENTIPTPPEPEPSAEPDEGAIEATAPSDAQPAPPSGREIRIPAGNAAALAKALSTAEDGDVILLPPGRYHARLILRLGARIVGAGGSPGETVILAGDNPAVVVESGAPVLENLTLESGDAPAVVVTGGSPRLVRVWATSRRSHGLIARGEAKPVVERSVLRAGANGARFEDRSSGRLDHCDVIDSGLAAIAVLGKAEPEITANLITGCADAGILLEAGGLVEGNVARGCKLSGIEARGGTWATARSNTIEDSGLHGILARDAASGEFARNDVRGSRMAGIAVSSSARPRFVANVVRDGRAEGLLSYGADTSVHEGGSLLGNAGPGLALRDEADPVLSGFVIEGSSPAVSISGRARGGLKSLRLSGGGASAPAVGLDIAGEATTEISDCRIAGFKTGMLVHGGSPRLSGIEIEADGGAATNELSP